MSIYTPPTDENFTRDQNPSQEREISIGRIFDVPTAANPENAAIPTLKPDLYIYDIATLASALTSLRAETVKKREAIAPLNGALMNPMLDSVIERQTRLLGNLEVRANKGETRLVSREPVENIAPATYAYEVKTLRNVFDMAHNYAHQKVLEARDVKSCFTGAAEAVLKEVALDHVAALNSRECGHQYLETAVQIGSTVVRCNPGPHARQETLSSLRQQGIARPAVFQV